MIILHLVMSNDFAGIEQHVNELAISQMEDNEVHIIATNGICLLYTSPSPRDATLSRMPSSA